MRITVFSYIQPYMAIATQEWFRDFYLVPFCSEENSREKLWKNLGPISYHFGVISGKRRPYQSKMPKIGRWVLLTRPNLRLSYYLCPVPRFSGNPIQWPKPFPTRMSLNRGILYLSVLFVLCGEGIEKQFSQLRVRSIIERYRGQIAGKD